MKGATHTPETRAKMRAAVNPSHASGEQAVNWKGGRRIDRDGYVWLYRPEHPDAVGNYMAEHRLVMERLVGRRLQTDEHVHHRNHMKHDNHPDNLCLMSQSEHMRLHSLERHSQKRREAAHAQ